MSIIIFNPSKGGTRQGDVFLWPLPEGYELSRTSPIAVRDGRIIIAEGEATGHHHSILAHVFDPPRCRDDGIARAAEADFKPTVGVASLFRDDGLLKNIDEKYAYRPGDLIRLCVGFLAVEHAPVKLEHQEHDTQLIPPGIYYAGRQQEFNAGEMRRVQD